MVKVIDSVEMWESFCKKIRLKHPEFYWAIALGRIEALRSELELIVSQLAERDREIRHLTSELDSESHEVQTLSARIIEQEAQISEQAAQMSEQEAQISEQEAQISEQETQISQQEGQISGITGSIPWRLLSRYGRIKYRYLLPIYRLFGRLPAARTETMPVQNKTSPEGPPTRQPELLK